MTTVDPDDARCARCQRPLLDCPGEAKLQPDGRIICEPCTVRIALDQLDIVLHPRKGRRQGRH